MHGFAGDRCLAGADQGGDAVRQVDVEARAEADQAEALAGLEPGAFTDEAYDAPCDETGDLHHREAAAVGKLDDEAVALVGLAGLVEGGAHEAAGVVGDAGHAAGERGAVHVAVEDAHEDADPRAGFGAEAELGGRRGGGDGGDDAVGGADDKAFARRGDPRRIAKEVDAPDGQDEADRRQRAGEEQERERHERERTDEAPALAVHGLDHTRKQRHRPSHSPQTCEG